MYNNNHLVIKCTELLFQFRRCKTLDYLHLRIWRANASQTWPLAKKLDDVSMEILSFELMLHGCHVGHTCVVCELPVLLFVNFFSFADYAKLFCHCIYGQNVKFAITTFKKLTFEKLKMYSSIYILYLYINSKSYFPLCISILTSQKF